MRVERFLKFFCLSYLFFSFSLAASVIFPPDEKDIDLHQNLFLFKKLSKKTLVNLKIENHDKVGSRFYRHYSTEVLWSFSKYMKFFGGYSLEYGNLHNEDWELVGAGDWRWRETEHRSESSLFFGIEGRKQLKFLPGKSWLFSPRVSFIKNLFNQNNTLKLNPKLRYMQWRDGRPFITWFGEYAHYLALNFDENGAYKTYWYIGAMFHFNKNIAIGSHVGQLWESWVDTAFFRTMTNNTLKVDHDSKIIALNISLRL
jgi:hypothetical protein